jgi:diamine N-acetyltransferase
MSLPFIRRATPDDAERLAALACRSFTETFGHLYPPGDLARFLATSYTPQTQREALTDPQRAIWLLEAGEELLGHAYVGPSELPHPEVGAGDGEIKRLYVLRKAHNGGWGSRLMQVAMAWLLRDGPRVLWVGVWSQNLGAQRFYQRFGFSKVGDYEFPVGDTRDHEFILRRAPG